MKHSESELRALEIKLMKAAIALIVRTPDAWERIESALETVRESGDELKDLHPEFFEKKPRLRLIKS